MAHVKNQKSFRHSANGYVPRGPERWKRAAENAANNPGSVAAKLFFSRLDVADAVVDNSILEDTSYCHLRRSWNGDWEREYYTCSAHCVTIQVMLDGGFEDSGAFGEGFIVTDGKFSFYRDEPQCKVRPTGTDLRPSRTVRCQVCGGKINSAGMSWPAGWLDRYDFVREEELPEVPAAVQEPLPMSEDLHTFFVNINDGTIIVPESLRMVVVSSSEAMLLLESDNAVVSRYGERYGAAL